MREDEVYIYTKNWFNSKKINIIAGQPPSGSDNIPVVEIKDEKNHNKGSRGSYKPDLIAINENNLVIIECKPIYNEEDYFKLLSVKFNEERKIKLYEELKLRGLIQIYFNDYNELSKVIKYCLSNASITNNLDYVSNLTVNESIDECKLINPKNINEKITID